MWREGSPYQRENIYSIQGNSSAPVHYDAHTLKPHSMTHAESSLHVLPDGKPMDAFFEDGSFFYGAAVVVKFRMDQYRAVNVEGDLFHHEISKAELIEGLRKSGLSGEAQSIPPKVLITTEAYPQNSDGYHSPAHALTLSQGAADFLISSPAFNGFGTSWKSTDFQPNSSQRPIHKTIFQKAIVYECLDLQKVPAGMYFFVGAPIRLSGASESPVCPMLFSRGELSF
jgi:kynurenine formamidase